MPWLRNRTILITGGTGSFGKWMTSVLLKYNFKEIRIFSRDEEKQLDMSREFKDARIRFVLGDVRDQRRLEEATDEVDILYHAAALKIVPDCERHPIEALRTNVLGTSNVKAAAIKNRVSKSILVSTDKAVKPVNLYGMTKAIAEKVWVNDEFPSVSTFSVVRYGNVIGSRGSVIPHFKQLIQERKPLPLTDQSMTRFLITLQQAVDLVLLATRSMRGCEIFVPKIPACKMIDLARVMAGPSYPLEIVGVRPGEKIHECLVQEDEFRRAWDLGSYYVIKKKHNGKSAEPKEFTSENAIRLDKKGIRKILKSTGWM